MRRVAPALLGIMLPLLSISVPAAVKGHGRVNIQGTIVDSPCAISAGDRDQTISMTATPVGNIIREGKGNDYALGITLIGCTFSSEEHANTSWKKFSITFSGPADGNDFRVSGDAQGVALRIMDNRGNIVKPGMPLPEYEIQLNKTTLSYRVYLTGNDKLIEAGDYSAVIRFNLTYY